MGQDGDAVSFAPLIIAHLLFAGTDPTDPTDGVTRSWAGYFNATAGEVQVYQDGVLTAQQATTIAPSSLTNTTQAGIGPYDGGTAQGFARSMGAFVMVQCFNQTEVEQLGLSYAALCLPDWTTPGSNVRLLSVETI